MAVPPIPDGYHSVSPYLVVDDVSALIEFLQYAFQAEEIDRTQTPDGKVWHAAVRLGDSVIMMGESPTNMPAMVHLYLEDVDAAYRRALAGGVRELRSTRSARAMAGSGSPSAA